ncbi:hypothetical protein PHMEG_00024929 [Phytophthora megakarya]|uniref:Reverse transcriptase n=1 Tax=Phytophthora megakarya TaxID=4795 RepID=A0A225VD99_9STRA|nr:hypothetical protein PHMEG_00024929 [Phytophthora megakarya]
MASWNGRGQTIMHSIRAYVEEPDQTDWDDHAKKLMHVMNTSFDATRLDTPFYLLHGYAGCSTHVAERTAYEWRRKLQRDYSYAHACAEELQKRAKSAVQTQMWKVLSEHLKSGFEVGLSRKLAHLWHGPFRIEQVRDEFKVKLKIQGTGYRVEPWVHISRLKPRALCPKRPSLRIDVSEEDDFDAALLPEDSWEPNPVHQEYEVEIIVEIRWTKRTRNAKRIREYLIK